MACVPAFYYLRRRGAERGPPLLCKTSRPPLPTLRWRRRKSSREIVARDAKKPPGGAPASRRASLQKFTHPNRAYKTPPPPLNPSSSHSLRARALLYSAAANAIRYHTIAPPPPPPPRVAANPLSTFCLFLFCWSGGNFLPPPLAKSLCPCLSAPLGARGNHRPASCDRAGECSARDRAG